MLKRFVAPAIELARVPVKGDLLLKKRADPSFPNEKVFDRFGPKKALSGRVREFCLEHPDLHPAAALFVGDDAAGPLQSSRRNEHGHIVGFVYLLRSGRNYKIGRTNATGRREYELDIQLPERAEARILRRGDSLFLRWDSDTTSHLLTAHFTDGFSDSFVWLRFLRDTAGHVSRMTVHQRRVWRMDFVRQARCPV